MSKSQNKYIKNKAIETGEIEGYEYWVHPGAGYGGYCGYIVFKNRPVRESSYSGILTYVPVHGGITYTNHDDLGSVYGFDTSHYNSNEYPINETSWIKEQITTMLHGIQRAAEVEKKYLRCISNKGKAKHCDYVQEIGEPEHRQNFGTNINLLSGQL